ncbi:MAG: insulinase family protein [Eubacteriaceae bacterium]|nr:insulinase family protein [Eubacteriaceae bacterium]
MKIKDIIEGFTIERIRPVEELSAEMIEMTHKKTGLQLLWLKRDEANKTFGIAFKTLPIDDTGVFHILEHSVLGGSERYTVKEPFVELLKCSMNTFLNAMTFPDKTFYPVSSTNEKDFINLMRVYLDAVFCPLIYTKPEIFYQEGWHYHLDEEGKASYKGVVFNEMKGALAGADELEEAALNRALFPDSPYRFISGGDPAAIPDLSYEQFVNCHREHYSPSNGQIILDGDMDIEYVLRIINEEYLNKFTRGHKIPNPQVQAPVDGGVQLVEYELGEDEDEKKKTKVAWGRVFACFDEREKTLAMHILADVLCGSNQSLLSKYVLSEGVAEAVTMTVYDGMMQEWVKLEVANLEESHKAYVEKLIFNQLERIANDGIAPELIEASMASIEYQMRERDYGTTPQGLVFGMQILESWLYGGDPMEYLQVGNLFANLKEKMAKGYFEALIREVLLENPHRAKVIMVPSKTVGEVRRAKENLRLESEMAGWDDFRREEIARAQALLTQWQNTPDSEEDLATIPRLSLSDINPKPEIYPTEEGWVNGIKTLYHNVNCSGITNFALYFDADDLTEEEISQLSFLTDILGKMKTEKYSEEELDNKIRLLFGGLSFYVSTSMVRDNREKCKIKMGVVFGTMEKNFHRAFELVMEILTNTMLDDETTSRNLLKQLKTKSFQHIVMAGSGLGTGRISAQNCAAGVSGECAGGYEYYKWLSYHDENWDWEKLSSQLKTLIERIVCSNRLTLSLTGGNYEILHQAVRFATDALPCNGSREKIESVIKPWGKRREGIVIPADISFACAGGVLPDFGEKGFSGSMRIASKIITFAHLWNAVRVQGGAYGTGFTIRQDGITTSHSYRDPSAASSIKAYGQTAGFLEKFASQPDVDISGFIIGAVSDVMPLSTPRLKGMKADAHYWAEITYEYREKLLKEMLATKPADLVSLAASIGKVYDDSGLCVVGSRQQLEECELDVIETL